MATHQYLIYYIHLTDAAQVAALQGAGEAQGAVLWSPDAAAAEYSAPILQKTDPFVAPSITSEWFGTADDFPTNVAAFDRKSGGLFGWSWLFGTKTTFHWRGLYVYAPPLEVPVPGDVVVIPRRRWIDGFELPQLGEGGSGGATELACSRLASRHSQGYGLAIRGTIATPRKHDTTEAMGGAKPQSSWERFYIRPRVLPADSVTFWRCRDGFSEAGVGLLLRLTPTGQIAVFSSTNVDVYTLLGTTAPLTLHAWVRIDLVVWFGQAGAGSPKPELTLWINGTVALTFSNPLLPMVAVNKTHGSSEIGVAIAHTMALDVDDWICADNPGSTSALDFQNGSAVVPLAATGLGASGSGPWVGDWRNALQVPLLGSNQGFSSAVSASRLVLTTDADEAIDAVPESLGCVAITVGAYHTGDTAALGLGVRLNGTETLGVGAAGSPGTPRWINVLYRPVGAGDGLPVPVTPVELVFIKGASVTGVSVSQLAAVAELIGVFGPEDAPHTVPPPAPLPPIWGQHNAPYPRTIWARQTTPPLQPVFVRAGTYVGTGTFKDLVFPVPIHWLWVRAIGGSVNTGTRWWSTLLAAHGGAAESVKPQQMVQAGIDPTFVPIVGEVLVAGNYTDVVATVKADCVARGISLAGDCGAFEIVKRVAWQLRSTGAGVLEKLTGANCAGRAVDVICYPDGSIYDILVNAGTDNTPAWQTGTPVDPARYRAAIDPGDIPDEAQNGPGQQQQTVLRIIGADAGSNTLSTVYAYVAVGDPGMRFMVNDGLMQHKSATDIITPLIHPGFTPLAAFLWQEELAGGGANRHYYKGPGHASASISPVTGAEVANALVFGPGTLTSKTAIHDTSAQDEPVSCWRVDDNSGHAGAVVQILSYIGNGTASRSIALTPASGKRPLFALVVPHTVASFQRDPSHTGTTSTNLGTGVLDAATGITGGDIDTILVGSLLNVNAVTYDVFVIPGSIDAGNGGWSVPGDFMPVPPEPPPGAPGPEGPEPGETGPPEEVPPPAVVPSVPGLPVAGTCLDATTKICNVALSHLGVTQEITALLTEQTREAYLARLHYIDELEATLRAFPWPFATKYVTPTWVAGSVAAPVNDDWTYAYQVPSDYLFGRRFVKVGGTQRSLDTEPILFRVGTDPVTGIWRLYSNVEIVDARLEYTYRPVCAALSGDVLFRTALGWRLAFTMGPGLSRDAKLVSFCWSMYLASLPEARIAAANEGQQGPNYGDAPWISGR